MEAKEILRTRKWVEEFVVGLNVCPFAGLPASKNQIRYAMTAATDIDSLFEAMLKEWEFLVSPAADEIETSILIHPNVLNDFLEYVDFLEIADQALIDSGLEGIIQVASFHPNYQFEGSELNDPANYTNRSPYPMLHFLREASVEEAIERHPDVEGVPEVNIRKMRAMNFVELQNYRSID